MACSNHPSVKDILEMRRSRAHSTSVSNRQITESASTTSSSLEVAQLERQGVFLDFARGGREVSRVRVPTAPTPQVRGQLIEPQVISEIGRAYSVSFASKSPNATGPDLIVPETDRDRLGFTIGDVKPLNAEGVLKFFKQLDGWRDRGWEGNAALFGYDSQGRIFLHGIYPIAGEE